MNQYAQRLRDLQERPSHKLKEIGDQWQTPKPLAWGLFHHFAPKIGPVVLDLFADMSNALVGCFYTAADNAMTQDWAGDSRRQGGACYGNPPYSRPEFDEKGNPITGMESILAYCREQRHSRLKPLPRTDGIGRYPGSVASAVRAPRAPPPPPAPALSPPWRSSLTSCSA